MGVVTLQEVILCRYHHIQAAADHAFEFFCKYVFDWGGCTSSLGFTFQSCACPYMFKKKKKKSEGEGTLPLHTCCRLSQEPGGAGAHLPGT